MKFNQIEKLLSYLSFQSKVFKDDMTLSFFEKDVAFTLSTEKESPIIYFDMFDLAFKRTRLSIDIPAFYIENFLLSCDLAPNHLLLNKNIQPKDRHLLKEISQSFSWSFQQQLEESDYPEFIEKFNTLIEKHRLDGKISMNHTPPKTLKL